jgi:hypothetical protein
MGEVVEELKEKEGRPMVCSVSSGRVSIYRWGGDRRVL